MKQKLTDAGWSEEGAEFVAARAKDSRINGALRRFGFKAVRHNPPSSKVNIPTGLRWKVWERDNFTCAICGKRQRLSVDHIHPESKGGTLDIKNLQTLCVNCNSRKGAK